MAITLNASGITMNSGAVVQDTSGTAPVYLAIRAWVNFNGTGAVSVRASVNVTSITDNGTGDYTVNITTAVTDANYAAFYSGAGLSASGGSFVVAALDFSASRTTSALRFTTIDVSGIVGDPSVANIVILR